MNNEIHKIKKFLSIYQKKSQSYQFPYTTLLHFLALQATICSSTQHEIACGLISVKSPPKLGPRSGRYGSRVPPSEPQQVDEAVIGEAMHRVRMSRSFPS